MYPGARPESTELGAWARHKGVTFFPPPPFKTGNTAFKPIREMDSVNQQQSVGFESVGQ